MGRQSEPETLLGFPVILMARHEAMMDLGNGCFPTGGHVSEMSRVRTSVS